MKHKLLSILLCLAMALSLLPTAALAEGETAKPVKVGETGFETLEEAIAAAEPVNGVITYAITGKVEVNSTEAWIQVLKDGLSNVTAVKFVGAENSNAEICITNHTSVLADQKYDIDVSFEDLKLSHPNGAWVNDLGHATNYFACVLRNTDAANNTVTYTNCTFPNGVCNNQYGKTVFDNCKFTNATSGKYNLWNYGGNTEIKNSEFTGTRGIKAYSEGTDGGDITVADTTFTNLTEKAAIIASKPVGIVVEDISVSGDKGFITRDITENDEVELKVSGTGISGNFNITSNTNAEEAKSEFNITAGTFTGTLDTGYLAPGATINENGTVEMNPVAKVGTTEYNTLEAAFAALDSTDYKLELLGEESVQKAVWPENTPVYWKAGDQSEYAATLAAALTAAYKAGPSDDITIVCRPGADVGTMTHGHVADNLTIYGNNAYLSGGECDLEVDTYQFSRETGAQATDGAYLEKGITITAYELDNLGVWGQRNTAYMVNINLTDCDGKAIEGKDNLQRVYISNPVGENNITLINCDFLTKATAVYSNADGEVTIKSCSFTGSQVPVNINHKAGGTQKVMVMNSTFTNCGDNDSWKQFAAPIRFVNSGNGTMSANVSDCTITGTKGTNGDILLGDGRTGEKSNNLELTVSGTAANVQAQKPGYYNAGTADVTKMMAKRVAENERLETSVNKLLPNAAKIGNTEYATLKEALESLRRTTTEENVTIELLADQNVAGFTVDLSNSAIKTLTIQGNGKKLDSLVNGVGIDGPTYCPVINAKLPANATFSVDGIVAPNSLLFDTGNEASLVVMNSIFNESQTGYPAAKNITYQGNTFEFKGDASKYYTNNAYPIWYKTETTTRSIAFLNNKVTGPRGFHIETRSTDADKQVNIKANGNTFNLSDSMYENKTIALQLVANLNGEIEFKDNQVNAYMGVCFFKDIAAQNDSKLTIKNNYTSGKLYGSSEWNTDGSTTEEKIAAADNFARGIVEGRKSADNGSAITEGHTHNYVNGKCTICGQTAPSYSGGSSSDPTYSVSTPSKTEHGTVTVSPKNASKGDRVTVTVKPDSGYILETLTVTDKNGNELTLKDKGNGKYTFTMPAGKVEVKATFMEDNSMLNFFYDVPNNAYFYEAVKWAVKNGITDGVGNNLFAPEQPCTRAQIVTFLWRAAGSPEPKGAASGMTDVVSGSYYEKAVAWAIENGITTGTTTSTFSPDATCTRAQAVTFLARALNAKAASAAEFSDVPTDSYFAEAVAWAAANGVTEGIGGGLFGSDNDCTRGQIVTFLYRAYNK